MHVSFVEIFFIKTSKIAKVESCIHLTFVLFVCKLVGDLT